MLQTLCKVLCPSHACFSSSQAELLRFCHKEGVHTSAHQAISLTTERVGGPELGGSFYDASFGVLVEQQTDTMILHNAAHFHGTTLHKRDPNVKTTDIVHAGFSLLVVRGLHQRYAEYFASKASILPSAAKSRVEQLSVDTAMPDAPPMQEDVAMIHKIAESVWHGGKQT
jgi:hypothetical protein